MLQLYRLETTRRDGLGRYRAIVTASPQMRAEYLRYDVDPRRVHAVDLVVPYSDRPASGQRPQFDHGLDDRWRLLFLGRLTPLKGAHLLLDALPELVAAHRGHVSVTIAGDGPAREKLERHAERISRAHERIDIAFTGWLEADDRVDRIRRSDLLVVPSVWPEPFGMVGPEAGVWGVPAAGFAVGGIPVWLEDGVNGHLANGAPPTSRGLAAAILRCLSDGAHYAELKRGAIERASRYTLERHLAQVIPILEAAAETRSPTAGLIS
jgi:glycosyltransferase involved in cell wall biosynthesis